jgi:carboxymethylenebutenolidase
VCHSDASVPPAAADAGEVAGSRAFRLRSGDVEVLAHEAVAAAPTGAGVVVLPDVRGLHGYYRQLTERFAEVGVHAVAVDWFARTAQDDDRTEAFDWQAQVPHVRSDDVVQDVAAAAAHLRGLGARAVFTVGFCFGGSHSWRQSALQPGLAGAVGFYGRPERVGSAAAELSAPVLFLVADGDGPEVVDGVRAIADGAAERGVDSRFEVFAAPHSFFDRTAEAHAEHVDRAWRLVREFLADHTPA